MIDTKLFLLIILLMNNANTISSFSSTKSVNSSSSHSNTSLNSQMQVPNLTIISSVTMYGIIFLIGFLANTLVIIVTLFNLANQDSTSYLLLNLSLSDFLLISICLPIAVLDLFSQEIWYLGEVMCKFIPWLEHTLAYTSIQTIVAISIERSIAIISPLKAKVFFTRKRLTMAVFCIWLASTLASMPIMRSTIYMSSYHKLKAKHVNTCFISTREKWEMGYIFASIVLFYMLPCAVLFVLYGKTVCVVKKRAFKAASSENEPSRNKSSEYEIIRKSIRANLARECTRKKQDASRLSTTISDFLTRINTKRKTKRINEKHIIMLLIVMILLIALCHLPYRVFSIWASMATKEDLRRLGMVRYFNIVIFCRVTFYINSALNPIFYQIISSKFRSSIRLFFRTHKQKYNSQYNTSMTITRI